MHMITLFPVFAMILTMLFKFTEW